jgi:glycosyltransferase involved in cell wall biosynthesis
VKLSIIIPNYNYGNYLGAAIDSALALNWPEKEVIAVDDGSTDHSRDVIRSYGSRIIPLFLSNGGQNRACNIAFERSSGEIIIFLDSDDVLFPSVADTLRSAWSDRVSKLQWSLVLVDENLTPLGRRFPTYRTKPTPDWVRRTLLRTGHYPFSTNGAWARSFLRQVFPIPVRDGIHRGGANGDHRLPVIDHYLSVLAPFFGDVICIDDRRPQGAYRMHGNNNHFRAESFEHYADTSMEPFECARRVNNLLSRLNIAHQPINAENDENVMKRQLVCRRLKLQPSQCSTLPEALWKYWRSVGLADASVVSKVKWCVWSLVVAATPKLVSLWAIQKRPQGSLSVR